MHALYKITVILCVFSDVDDFIVDEEGQPISKKAKKKKHIIHSDS